MSAIEQLVSEATCAVQRFGTSPAIQRLVQGDLTVDHYAEYLKQVYYHTRENPQLQVLATAYFRGEQRGVIRRFFSHASAEIGHERMALDDLAALGVDTRRVPFENPLPATMALIAFPFYQVRSLNPVGYLGYLYFLEALPTAQGPGFMQRLSELGVPEQAMTFLRAHSEVDRAHVLHMEYYAEQLLTTQHALHSALYAVKATGELYAAMASAALQQVDAPRDYGLATTELPACDDEPLLPLDLDAEDEDERPAPSRTQKVRRADVPAEQVHALRRKAT